MQKRSHPSLTILGLIIALLAVLTIAAGPQAQRAITDMLGRRVMVSDPLQRVVILKNKRLIAMGTPIEVVTSANLQNA